MNDIPWVLVGCAVWNLCVFGVYGYDKLQAIRGRRRVSERRLLLVAALAGVIGAWCASLLFRHKIRKPAFMLTLSLLTVIWCITLWQWNPRLLH